MHILARMWELRNEEELDTESHLCDLLALADSTQHAGVPPASPLNQATLSEIDAAEPGRLVTFLPVKGGSGASTAALHAAEAIARKTGRRILLLDLDLHSGTTAFRLGIEPPGSLEELLAADDLDARRVERAAGRWGSLDVLVPRKNLGLGGVDFTRLDAVLRKALQRYAFVVADHPDGIFSSSQVVLGASAAVYLVCNPEIASLHLARQKRRLIETSISRPGNTAMSPTLVVNRAGSMGALSRSDVERVTGLRVSACLANDYAAVRRANWQGGLVERSSALARDFEDLADHVLAGLDRLENGRAERATAATEKLMTRR